MGLLKALQYLFFGRNEPITSEEKGIKQLTQQPRRRHISDVKTGDRIRYYKLWKYNDPDILIGTCINNDKDAGMILLKTGYDIEEAFSYTYGRFVDFHVLNPHIITNTEREEIKKSEMVSNINKLQHQVKQAIQSEDWNRADELNEEIKKAGNRAPEL